GRRPPLSVGLFGDGGSRKSFLIAEVQDRIRRITRRARRAEASAFCSYVRNIEFNAWHYADANLWASLVTHIFDELAQPEAAAGPADEKAESQQLLAQHEVERAALEAARSRHDAARAQRQKLEQRLANVEAGSDA